MEIKRMHTVTGEFYKTLEGDRNDLLPFKRNNFVTEHMFHNF